MQKKPRTKNLLLSSKPKQKTDKPTEKKTRPTKKNILLSNNTKQTKQKTEHKPKNKNTISIKKMLTRFFRLKPKDKKEEPKKQKETYTHLSSASQLSKALTGKTLEEHAKDDYDIKQILDKKMVFDDYRYQMQIAIANLEVKRNDRFLINNDDLTSESKVIKEIDKILSKF